MTFEVIADAEAQCDWDEAVDWYERQEPGTGPRFDDALRNFLHLLVRDPERFPLASRLTRKAKMPEPWPLSVYFVINKEHSEIKLVAIWHGRRNPALLRRRMA